MPLNISCILIKVIFCIIFAVKLISKISLKVFENRTLIKRKFCTHNQVVRCHIFVSNPRGPIHISLCVFVCFFVSLLFVTENHESSPLLHSTVQMIPRAVHINSIVPHVYAGESCQFFTGFVFLLNNKSKWGLNCDWKVWTW